MAEGGRERERLLLGYKSRRVRERRRKWWKEGTKNSILKSFHIAGLREREGGRRVRSFFCHCTYVRTHSRSASSCTYGVGGLETHTECESGEEEEEWQ